MDCRRTGAAAVRGAIAFMSTALLAGASPALSTAATPPPPTATTGAVSSVGTSSATANGTVGYTLVSSAIGGGGDVFTYDETNGKITRTCSGNGGGCIGGSW